jgi:hypothetical protein
MTAASESVTWLASRGQAIPASGLGPMLRRWERVLVFLAVCLPVPVLAATGLSIPLPAPVERLAAALVPWVDTANLEADESLTVGADGAIVLARNELAGIQAGQPTAFGEETAGRSRTATSGSTRPGKDGGAKGGGTATSGETDGTSSGPAGGSSSSGGSSSGDSGGSSGPVQSVVDQAGPATQPVVDVVQDTVDDPAGTVGGVVEDAGDAAGGVLPVAGP